MRKIIFVSLLVVFLLVTRAFIAQYSFIEKAKKAHDPINSIKYYERALLFYLPFSPCNKEAIEGILNTCETLTKSEHKIYCYETLRSSLYQIISFYQPYKEKIEIIEPLIADLKTSEMIRWSYNNFSDKDYQTLYNYHLKILKYESFPSSFWSLVSVFSLICWIASVIVIILKGLTIPSNKKYLLTGGAVYIIFFSLWLLSLYMA